MKKIFGWFLLILMPALIAAQTDGTIVERTPCPAYAGGTYEQYVEAARAGYVRRIEESKKEGIKMEMPADFSKRVLSKEEFEKRAAYVSNIDCQRIKYMSDNLKVAGYIWKPKNTDGKKLPVIIFNRGGNREQGKLSAWTAFGFYYFVSNGFVVIGSQYRGADGGEGKDEYGGADARDVMNLIPLAKSLDFADTKNTFLLGNSRGGMMAYLALKNKISVNAAAVSSGVTDLFGNAQDHPDYITNIYQPLIPDFDKRRDEAMRERSAVYWADKINVPVLIMHGGADERVGTTRSLAFAQKLQESGKTYELIIYAGDDHNLTLNRTDSDRRVLEWFKKYLK